MKVPKTTTPPKKSAASAAPSGSAFAEAERILACKDNYFEVLRITIAGATPLRSGSSAPRGPQNASTTDADDKAKHTSVPPPPLLHVSGMEDLTTAAVRRCFRSLAAQLHPDRLHHEAQHCSAADARRYQRCLAAFKIVVDARDSLETASGRAVHYSKHYQRIPGLYDKALQGDVPGSQRRRGDASAADTDTCGDHQPGSFAAWAAAADSIRSKTAKGTRTEEREGEAAAVGPLPGHRCGLWSSSTYAPQKGRTEAARVHVDALSGAAAPANKQLATDLERRRELLDPLRRLQMWSCGDTAAAHESASAPPGADSRHAGALGGATDAAVFERSKPGEKGTDGGRGKGRRWGSATDRREDARFEDELPRTRQRT